MIELNKRRVDFERGVERFREDIKSLRTGRANGSMVENILVEAYGVPTPMIHVASISIPDPKTILITPWDKSVIKDIEKAIVAANLGLSPASDGAGIRIAFPNLTEENRRNLVKLLNQKTEGAKIIIRGVRDKLKDEIGKAEKSNEITEDDRYELQKELDEITREFTALVEKFSEEKERDIMTL